ncbi:unnamed protein product [Phytophthora fragariaefolia]|uniref:Unnamed protein product n=1 Tax=Phytophthora fragariaefolia TaxID=1490495 RepID=A0A9W7D1Z4_9STRA|nr:unnamed protein product [Phytophthora fragariaefolia]
MVDTEPFDTLIPFGYIPDRWCYNSAPMIHRFVNKDFDQCGFSESTIASTGSSRTASQSERFLEARRSTKRLAETLSMYGSAQFKRALTFIDRISDALDTCTFDLLDKCCTILQQGREGQRHQRPRLRVSQEPHDGQSGEPQGGQPRRQTPHRAVDAQWQSPQDEPQSPQDEPQSPRDELQPLEDGSHLSQDGSHLSQDGSNSSQNDLQLAQNSTNSADNHSAVSVTSTAPQIIEILDDECDSDKDGAEPSCFAKASLEMPKRPRLWSMSRVVRPAGRPRRTQRQRQLERRKKFHEITALLQVHGKPTEDEGTRVNLAELRRRFDDEPVTYHRLHDYLTKFSELTNIPPVEEAFELCVAVPTATRKLKTLCQEEYRERNRGELEDENVLLKFQFGHNYVYPKITADFIYTMGAWHGAKMELGRIEASTQWIRSIDTGSAHLDAIFGDGGKINTEDVCAFIAHIDLVKDEEAALLKRIHSEVEDIVLTAAISALCKDANSRPHAQVSSTFTTQLLAIRTDEERLEWLKKNKIAHLSEEKIVGALWMNTNHWCGLGICTKQYVYTIMDPRNDKFTIEKIDRIFRQVFLPLLPSEKRWKRDVSRYFQQTDGSSCGVLVLAFIESYLFPNQYIPSDTKLLRFRYLLKKAATLGRFELKPEVAAIGDSTRLHVGGGNTTRQPFPLWRGGEMDRMKTIVAIRGVQAMEFNAIIEKTGTGFGIYFAKVAAVDGWGDELLVDGFVAGLADKGALASLQLGDVLTGVNGEVCRGKEIPEILDLLRAASAGANTLSFLRRTCEYLQPEHGKSNTTKELSEFHTKGLMGAFLKVKSKIRAEIDSDEKELSREQLEDERFEKLWLEEFEVLKNQYVAKWETCTYTADEFCGLLYRSADAQQKEFLVQQYPTLMEAWKDGQASSSSSRVIPEWPAAKVVYHDSISYDPVVLGNPLVPGCTKPRPIDCSQSLQRTVECLRAKFMWRSGDLRAFSQRLDTEGILSCSALLEALDSRSDYFERNFQSTEYPRLSKTMLRSLHESARNQIAKDPAAGDQAAGEEEDWELAESGKDALIVLLDVRKAMFSPYPNTAQEKSPPTWFHAVVELVIKLLKSKVVANDNSLLSVVFFGTVSGQAVRGLKKKDSQRIWLFTNDDCPQGPDAEEVGRIQKQVQLKRTLNLFYINPPEKANFNLSAFYGCSFKDFSMAEDDEGFENEASYQPAFPVGSLDELMDGSLRKRFRKRRLTTFPLHITKGVSIGVELYALVVVQRKNTPMALDASTNTPLKTETKWLCEDTGAYLTPDQIKKYIDYGGKRVYFTRDDVVEIKHYDAPGLQLICFKPLGSLKCNENIRSPYFVYPCDGYIEGSSTAFAAILNSMIRKEKFALARLIARKTSEPRLVALVPQEEESDEMGQVQPSGFNVIFLPYLDDIRDIPVDPVTNELQKHYSVVQALALDEEVLDFDETKDTTLPDTEGFGHDKVKVEFNKLCSVEGDESD